MSNRPRPLRPASVLPAATALLPLALLAVLLPPATASAAGTFVEKTVEVPRATKVPVNITFEKAAIRFVESQNDPGAKDVADADRSDPKDKTWIVLRFTYDNEGYVSHKVSLRVLLLDEAGGVLAEGGRSSSLDRQAKADTISFPIHVKTLDWPKAAKLKVLATFYD
jgi:hypothetical protein